MNREGDGEATADASPPESIDAFLDREFATALATELAKGQLPEAVQKSLIGVASSASPGKKAWLNAVDPLPEARTDG